MFPTGLVVVDPLLDQFPLSYPLARNLYPL